MEELVWCVRFGGLCFVAAGAVTFLRRPAWLAGGRGDVLFLVLCLAGLFLTRTPAAVSPLVLNPDEAQTLAQADKFLGDPVPWRSVDGVTVGPVNSWMLSLFLLAGFPLSAWTARVAAMLLLGAALACVFVFSRRHAGSFAARAALLPWFVALGFTLHHDYQHFASEIPSLLLLAGALAVFPTASTRTGPLSRLAVSGVLLGLTPFTKLQAAPLAVFIAAALGVALIVRRRKLFTLPLFAFSAGVLLPGAGILAVTAAGGAFGDFVQSYLGIHDRYGVPFIGAADALGMFQGAELLRPLLVLGAIAAAVLAAGQFRHFKAGDPLPLLLLGGVAVSVFIVGKPGTSFPHYLLFFALALPVVLAMVFSREDSPFSRPAFVLAVVVLGTLPALELGANLSLHRGYSASYRAHPFLNEVREEELARQHSIMAKLGDSLRERFPGKNHELAVWGWMPELYVTARMRMATPDSVTTMAMLDHADRDYYRNRFVEDLRAARPPALVDATGHGCFTFDDRAAHGIESVEGLFEFVSAEYSLAGQFGPPGEGPRLYIRKDLVNDG